MTDRQDRCWAIKPERALRLSDKVATRGTAALSNAELLGLLAGVEPKRIDPILQGQPLVAVPTIPAASWVAALPPAAARRVALVSEVVTRVSTFTNSERATCSSPKDAYTLVKYLRRARKEHLVALYLDAQNMLIASETISIGSLNTTRTHPREILQPAIAHSALGFILAHNHPSGSLRPSQDDIDFTRAIKRACEIMGIGLYDHLIIGESGFVSLKEEGLL